MLLPNYVLMDDFLEYEALFQKYGTRKKVSKGAVLYDATSQQHVSYYIVSGMAKLSVINENGREVILCFHGRGGVYPINCMGNSLLYENHMYLTAFTDLEVIEFRSELILQMAAECPGLVAPIINRYGKYTILLVSKILLATYGDPVQLIASFLYLYSQQHGACISLTQDDIAKFTGTSLSHAVRAITKLRGDGIIRTHRGKIEVLDAPLLKEKYCKWTEDEL